jgi:hypothetical protein
MSSPASRQRSIWVSAISITHSPTSMASKRMSSITGRNAAGGRRPLSGCCQRISASAPMTVAGAHVHLRLVMENEFAGRQGAPDTLQALVVAAHAAILFGVEDVVAVLAGQLGLIHRLVGLPQQLVGIDLLGLRVEGDAEAGRHLEDASPACTGCAAASSRRLSIGTLAAIIGRGRPARRRTRRRRCGRAYRLRAASPSCASPRRSAAGRRSRARDGR